MCTTHYPVAAALALAVMLTACSAREAKPGDACDSISDCVGEQELACSQSSCVRLGCERTSGCPAGAACVGGVCGVAECATDDECPPRQRCFEGDCRADICAFKAECERGEVCNGDPPMCRLPPGRCEDDRDCPNDTFCQSPEQSCERKCTSDASCPPESYCGDEFCRLRCNSASDCAASDACVDGRCEPVSCPTESCPDEAPFLDPRSCTCVQCLDDSDCSAESGLGCSDQNRCVFCVLKSDNPTTCADQGLSLLEGCCAECLEDRDCPTGTGCALGRCVLDDPRECVLDSECPNGARCDLGFCVQPGSRTACTAQTDCPAGEACYGDGRCRAASDVCQDCSAPSRCAAEPGDTVGSCVGCTTSCSAAGCGAQLCWVPDGATEGFCVEPDTVDCP